MARAARPHIHVWRPPSLEGVELQWCHEVKVGVPRHFHDGYQLGLVVAGALEVTIAQRTERAEAGDLVVLDARVPHAMSGSADTPVSAIVMEISEARMRSSLQLDAGAPSPRFDTVVVRDEAAADALRVLHQSLSNHSGEQVSSQQDSNQRDNGEQDNSRQSSSLAQLDPLLCHLVVEHGAPSSHDLDGVRAGAVDEVRRFLDEHLTARLPLEQLARRVGASKFQLIRCFKRVHGVPPLGYQMQRRINRAKERLAQGEPIVQIAIDLGFADQSHFTRHFRRLTLMTPGDYQRSLRAD